MATITVNLEETDICDAIDLWVRAKGMVPRGRARVTVTKGDRPFDGDETSASIEAEMADPQR